MFNKHLKRRLRAQNIGAIPLVPTKGDLERFALSERGVAVNLRKHLPRSKYQPHQGKREIARRLARGKS